MEDIKKIEENYKNLKGVKLLQQNLLAKKSLLENNPLIKSYLEIVESSEKIEKQIGCDITELDDNDLILKAVDISKITDVSNIYVYIGSYISSDICDKKEFLVDYNNPSVEYRKYRNIDDKNIVKVVSVYETNDFESKNQIVYYDDYDKVRADYFHNLLDIERKKVKTKKLN